jgi:arylsulfatase A-like enzyme
MHNPRIHRGMPRRDLEHLVALYDAEIRFTDDILGEILAELDGRGMLDDTVIVVTADHGEEFLEHGSRGHGQTLFDEVLRVPLIVHWRGTIDPLQVVETQVGLIDLMPTLLAIAGAPPRTDIMGRDLSPLLRAEGMADEPRLVELHLDSNDLVGLRTNASKFATSGGERFLHFDLEADRAEQHPLPNRGPAFDAGRAALQARVAKAHANASRRGISGAVPAEVDPRMRERLESLGYIDAE